MWWKNYVGLMSSFNNINSKSPPLAVWWLGETGSGPPTCKTGPFYIYFLNFFFIIKINF